jgi:hypothetical protein
MKRCSALVIREMQVKITVPYDYPVYIQLLTRRSENKRGNVLVRTRSKQHSHPLLAEVQGGITGLKNRLAPYAKIPTTQVNPSLDMYPREVHVYVLSKGIYSNVLSTVDNKQQVETSQIILTVE